MLHNTCIYSVMFSTKERLDKRTGEFGTGREEYLGLLVKEFQETTSEESRLQILANLANFAYDPINYEFLRKLKVIDIFLDQLAEAGENRQEFGIAGLCNLCLDPENREYILHQGGVKHLVPLLNSTNQEVVVNTITTLAFLVTPQSRPEITRSDIQQQMLILSQSTNIRIANLAKVFLSDYATSNC